MNENQTYYFTFGHFHPLADNWIEISAPSSDAAREAFVAQFGDKWVRQYDDTDWKPQYFPGGRVGRILEVI